MRLVTPTKFPHTESETIGILRIRTGMLLSKWHIALIVSAILVCCGVACFRRRGDGGGLGGLKGTAKAGPKGVTWVSHYQVENTTKGYAPAPMKRQSEGYEQNY